MKLADADEVVAPPNWVPGTTTMSRQRSKTRLFVMGSIVVRRRLF